MRGALGKFGLCPKSLEGLLRHYCGRMQRISIFPTLLVAGQTSSVHRRACCGASMQAESRMFAHTAEAAEARMSRDADWNTQFAKV
jgi:hypothetical protein